MTNAELIKELEAGFKETKKDLKFKSSFEDLDKIFFIKDVILKDKFVSDRLSRQICWRITETYNSWVSYLHNLVLPNPSNMINMFESKLFGDAEKEAMLKIMRKTIAHLSKNSIAGLAKDKAMEAAFIDESVEFWKNEFSPYLVRILKKANVAWTKQVEEDKKNIKDPHRKQD